MTARTIEAIEVLEILDNFLPLAVNGDIDPEVTAIIERTVCDIASGYEVMLEKGPLLDLVQTFFACFEFDDEEGSYRFQRDNYIATGETGPGLMTSL